MTFLKIDFIILKHKWPGKKCQEIQKYYLCKTPGFTELQLEQNARIIQPRQKR